MSSEEEQSLAANIIDGSLPEGEAWHIAPEETPRFNFSDNGAGSEISDEFAARDAADLGRLLFCMFLFLPRWCYVLVVCTFVWCDVSPGFERYGGTDFSGTPEGQKLFRVTSHLTPSWYFLQVI